jgi:hypothetical protein
VVVKICQLLDPDRDLSRNNMRALLLIPDPLAQIRAQLGRICDLLAEGARNLDAEQVRGHTPHPTASLMRGVARTIGQFLQGPRSYDTRLPDDLRETLSMVVAVLCGSADLVVFNALAQQVAAFDDDGKPSANLYVKPPGRLAAFYSRATSTVTGITAIVAALTGIAVPMIAVVLIVLGRLDIEGLLGHLP